MQFFVVMLLSSLYQRPGPLVGSPDAVRNAGDLTHYGGLRLWGSVGFIMAAVVAGPLLDRTASG